MNKKLLKKKINLFIFFTFSVFAFLFISFQLHHYLDIRSYYLSKVQKVTQSISDSFHFYYHNVQNIALHESVIKSEYRASSRYFDSLIALYPDYEYIVLTDLEGKLVTMNSIGSDGKKLPYRALRKTDLSDTAWFKAIAGEEQSNNIRKGIFGSHFSSLMQSDFAKEKLETDVMGHYFSTSVQNDAGEVTGYLTTFVNRNWIENKVDLADDINSIMHKELYVIDSKNKVIGFGEKNEILKELPFELKTSNLTKNLFAGDVVGVIKGIETFYQSPLYIASQFKHSNFLENLNWKLILKVDKKEFFKDFIIKFSGFCILFFIWVLFVKQLEFSFLDILKENVNIKETDDLEKIAFYKKFYAKSFESFQNEIKSLVEKLEQIEISEPSPMQYKKLEIEDPYEKYIETAQALEQTKEAFLKYEVYTDNEMFFGKELDSYLKRANEDLNNTKNEISNLKRELLNMQVKHDINDSTAQAMELVVSRVEMMLVDLMRGLSNVSQRNNESRAKKSAGWGEFKSFVYEHLLVQVNKFKNITEDQAFFTNDIQIYNDLKLEKHMDKEKEIEELKAQINEVKAVISELAQLLQAQNLSQDDLTEDDAA